MKVLSGFIEIGPKASNPVFNQRRLAAPTLRTGAAWLEDRRNEAIAGHTLVVGAQQRGFVRVPGWPVWRIAELLIFGTNQQFATHRWDQRTLTPLVTAYLHPVKV